MPAGHFSEWLVCVPLMAYIAISAGKIYRFYTIYILIYIYILYIRAAVKNDTYYLYDFNFIATLYIDFI